MITDSKTPVTFVRGIGEARAKQLAKLGIFTAGDLLYHFPRAYEERGNIRKISECAEGGVFSVVVTVELKAKEARGKSGTYYVKTCASDGTGTLYMTFFNNKWIAPALVPGRVFRVYGRIEAGLYGYETVNPVLEPYSPDLPPVIPVYPLTGGLTRSFFSGAVKEVLPLADRLPEVLPDSIRTQFGLIPKRDAIRQIHFPSTASESKTAVRRLAFEELTVFQLALAKLREGRVSGTAVAMTQRGTGVRRFFEGLPFELTGAQKRAVREIFDDMLREKPMMRLVQGDVGSGKTVLAAAAAFLAVKNGCQAAIMAPTEILAAQHFETMKKLLSPYGISVLLVTGSMTAAQKKAARSAVADGSADVIVGTNAVIQSGTEFSRLGLAVTDEQHRFGVMQRAALIAKGNGTTPHTLVMSATPIPRTLSLILYGDLDISVLDELPPGRQKTETVAIGEESRAKLNAFLRRELKNGRQVFVVCPLVEESEALDALSAEEKFEAIRKDFPEYTSELLHGKMKAAQKREVMEGFREGRVSILVSTTVIEVGVDVPNATVMVVENSERFGLSTLHQLRGRIGRGSEKSYCVLVYGAAKNEKSRERLETMCRTTDGFEIARTDLKLRGPGDFFGERQSGEMKFKVASIADMELVTQTRACVDVIIDGGLLSTAEFSALNAEAETLYINELCKNTLN